MTGHMTYIMCRHPGTCIAIWPLSRGTEFDGSERGATNSAWDVVRGLHVVLMQQSKPTAGPATFQLPPWPYGPSVRASRWLDWLHRLPWRHASFPPAWRHSSARPVQACLVLALAMMLPSSWPSHHLLAPDSPLLASSPPPRILGRPSPDYLQQVMSSKPIFVATHPRACSTAFERVCLGRGLYLPWLTTAGLHDLS